MRAAIFAMVLIASNFNASTPAFALMTDANISEEATSQIPRPSVRPLNSRASVVELYEAIRNLKEFEDKLSKVEALKPYGELIGFVLGDLGGIFFTKRIYGFKSLRQIFVSKRVLATSFAFGAGFGFLTSGTIQYFTNEQIAQLRVKVATARARLEKAAEAFPALEEQRKY